MLIYINDMLIVGRTGAIKDAIQVHQQSFEVKKPTMLEHYFGVQVIKSKNGIQAWLGQEHQHSLDRKLWMRKVRLWKTIKPFIDLEWEHYCISQSTPEWTLPMQ